MTVKVLHAGALSLFRGEDERQTFGMVDASAGADSEGVVRLSLDLGAVTPAVREGRFLYLELSIAWGEELARALGETVVRMRHIEALERLGMLTETAFEPDDTPATPSTMGIGPPAAALLWSVYRVDGVAFAYRTLEGTFVCVTFDRPRGLRTGSLDTAPHAAGSEGVQAEVIERSPWIDSLTLSPALSSNVRVAHLRVALCHSVIEVLAEGFWVRRGTLPFESDDVSLFQPSTDLEYVRARSWM